MKNNDLLICQILNFLLVKNMLFKLFSIVFIMYMFFYKKIDKENQKVNFKKIIVAIIVVFVNAFLNINLSVLNLVFFGIGSFALYLIKVNVNIASYSSLYLLIVLLIGGIKVCTGL